MKFADRHEAGQKLARNLSRYRNKKDVVLLGIPRGGVEVAFDMAKKLKVPLSVVVTKKIGHPFEPEFAIGSVGPNGHYSINKEYEAEAKHIKKTVKELNKEITRRYKEYTKGKLPVLKGKITVIVDDGLATGFTMISAIEYIKSQKPKKVIVAVAVAARDSYEKVKKLADEVVCLHIPAFFGAVGSFFREFAQLEDKEVKYYLDEAKKYL